MQKNRETFSEFSLSLEKMWHSYTLSFSLLKGHPKNDGGCVLIDWSWENRERE